MKATHQGQCQICSRIQKLPNTRLSQHGYTVEFSFFEGVCPGSKSLPYELSCDLIKQQIPLLLIRVTELEAKIISLNNRDGHFAYSKLYASRKGYYWDTVEFIMTNRGIAKQHKDKIYYNLCLPYGFNLEQVARYYDSLYISQVLKPTIKNIQDYIRHCQLRIDKWHLQPLEEIPIVLS